MSIQFKTINELSHMLKNKDISNKELIEETFSLIEGILTTIIMISYKQNACVTYKLYKLILYEIITLMV